MDIDLLAKKWEQEFNQAKNNPLSREELKKQFIRQKEQFFFLGVGATLFISGILLALFSPNTSIGITLSAIAMIGFIKAWSK